MYVLVKNSVVANYPYSVRQFRLDNPQISLPDNPTEGQLAEQGLFLVTTISPTVIENIERAEEVTPIFSEGVWKQQWVITPLTGDEINSLFTNTRIEYLKELDQNVDQLIKDCIGEKATEYQRAETQARAYKASGYSGDAQRSVKVWAEIKGWTQVEGADDIIRQADAWIAAQETIREKRLYAKEAYRVSTTVVNLNTARSTWLAFLAYIRSVLGLTN
jgi:hypothetical protein